MIIKAIQVVLKISRDTQLITELVYGREPYIGYDLKNGDEIDEAIFNQLRVSAKNNPQGEPFIKEYLNEPFKGIDYYRESWFMKKYFHFCHLQILPTGLSDLTEIEIDQLKLKKTEFIAANFQICWVNSKPNGNENLETMPREISISVNYEKFNQLVESFKPINFV
jgi:hypothetical protein